MIKVKSRLKQTTIIGTMNKNKSRSKLLDNLRKDGNSISDPTVIANNFNEHSANIGPTLAEFKSNNTPCELFLKLTNYVATVRSEIKTYVTAIFKYLDDLDHYPAFKTNKTFLSPTKQYTIVLRNVV